MIFLLFSVVIFILVTLRIPKKLERSELIAVAYFSTILGFVTDIILDLKYHLYGYFEPGVQFPGFLPAIILFPTAGVVFMNFFPFMKSLAKKLLYTFYWTLFCLGYEFLSVESDYFYHNGWKYWQSALAYPFLLWLHLVHLKIFRWYTKKSSQT
ncbi:hypothetical protein ACFSTA_17570 [Ornithinibacillus salinisoli]|uniref:Uncharacterized protein n=1 Tax=Ornithinibacillus salinisoli TaxID=1848459 RepID=A0ABW4W320_9BACI